MLCTVFPGLNQVRQGEKDKVVYKATVIVKFDQPVQRRGKS